MNAVYQVGDIVDSGDGYCVLVCAGENGELYGKLICPRGSSCESIPYHIYGDVIFRNGKRFPEFITVTCGVMG